MAVNYRSLLQRLMEELVKDEEAAASERQRQKEAEAAEAREKAKQEREAKKQEALERSRQRREADPTYFERRKVAEITTSTFTDSNNVAQETLVDESTEKKKVEEVDEEQHEEKDGDEPDDPFRSYKNKSRSRIFVR